MTVPGIRLLRECSNKKKEKKKRGGVLVSISKDILQSKNKITKSMFPNKITSHSDTEEGDGFIALVIKFMKHSLVEQLAPM